MKLKNKQKYFNFKLPSGQHVTRLVDELVLAVKCTMVGFNILDFFFTWNQIFVTQGNQAHVVVESLIIEIPQAKWLQN